jgi:hypothetical protein
MSLEIRAVIHFLWLKQTANQSILSELENVYGGDILILQAIQNWTAAFDGGWRELDNLPMSEQPHDIKNIDAVRSLIEEHGYRS